MEQVEAIGTLREGIEDDVFIFCESFEDRCLGAAQRGANHSVRLPLIVKFRPRTSHARTEAKQRKNGSDLYELLKLNYGTEPRRVKVDPYNPLDLRLALESQLATAGVQLRGATVTVDITCFTRIQLLFLLRLLQSRMGSGLLRIVYTSPQSYGSVDKHRLSRGYEGSYRLPYVVPGARRPGYGVALVVLLGHEGSRTLHAWSESDPEFTFLVLSTAGADFEMTAVAERQNESLLARARSAAPTFDLFYCESRGIAEGQALFAKIRGLCQDRGAAAMALVPTGPKPLVAAFSFAAMADPSLPVQVVYPVPQAYDPDYSTGIGSTYSYLHRQSP